MKIQKLTIHNLASIEDAVIDFEAPPLKDSEVFLITGKTGAGKTTILDAICLALFASTPRLRNTRMQGETVDADKTIKINDTRQLLRRNTGEASASLTFIGNNGIAYNAVWSVARARKKANGNMQAKNWQLTNLTTNHTLTKDAEIAEEIHRAIGLDFNQFCRTTMLAQGEFTRFLNSKDEEKAEILEKITGVDIYSKIGAKVFELTGQKESAWKEARLLVDGVSTFNEEEIKQRQTELENCEKECQSLKKEASLLNDKIQWLKSEADLTIALDKVEQEYKWAIGTAESEDFKNKEQIVNEWNDTIDARAWLSAINKANADEVQLKNQMESLAEQFANLLGGQQLAEEEKVQIEKSLKQTEDALIQEQDKAGVYEQAQTVVSSLRTIADGRDQISQLQSVIEREKKQLDQEMMPALTKQQSVVDEAKSTLEQIANGVKTEEEALAILNLGGLRQRHNDAIDLLSKIRFARDRFEALREERQRVVIAKQKLAEMLADIEDKKRKSSALDIEIHEAKQIMEERQQRLDRQRETVHAFAKAIRLKLQVGDTCPVCGQLVVNHLPIEEELAALVKGYEEEFNAAKVRYDNLVQSKNAVDAEVTTSVSTYNREKKLLDDSKSLNKAEQRVLEACKACGIPNEDDANTDGIDKLENRISKQKSDIDEQIRAGEEQEKRVKQLRMTLDGQHKKAQKLSEELSAIQTRINVCMRRISNAEALLKAKQSEVTSAEKETEAILSSGDWTIDWKTSPRNFSEMLTMAAKTYSETLKREQRLSAELKQSEINCSLIEEAIAGVVDAVPEWSMVKPLAGRETSANLLTRLREFGNKVSSIQSLLKTANDAQVENKAKLDQYLLDCDELTIDKLNSLGRIAPDEVRQLKKEVDEVNNRVISKMALLKDARTRLANHQKERPALQEQETIATLTTTLSEIEERQHQAEERKIVIRQELQRDHDEKLRLSSLIEAAAKKQREYEEWSRLNNLIGSRDGDKFRKIAQSYVLASLIHSANAYMRSLTDRYTLKVTPNTFVISIEDAYQGYVSRAASTISGGESFLVSLSLALALSDIGHRLSVDTIFIDEGFGTLSGEPLQNAINTLRSLHHKSGRHVGIISHVEELQERIHVQIQVNQEGNASSSVVRIVPENEAKG